FTVALFFNDTATTEIYTLSLHDALPISSYTHAHTHIHTHKYTHTCALTQVRSEEHTSELQSHLNLVCRLLLATKIKPPVMRHDRHDSRMHRATPARSRSL